MESVRHAERRKLMRFGAAIGMGLILLSFLRPGWSGLLIGCAIFVLATAFFLPRWIRIPYLLATAIGTAVWKVLILLVLSILFYLAISPLAFLRRLSAGSKRGGTAEMCGSSCWTLRSGKQAVPADLEKQF